MNTLQFAVINTIICNAAVCDLAGELRGSRRVIAVVILPSKVETAINRFYDDKLQSGQVSISASWCKDNRVL